MIVYQRVGQVMLKGSETWRDIHLSDCHWKSKGQIFTNRGDRKDVSDLGGPKSWKTSQAMSLIVLSSIWHSKSCIVIFHFFHFSLGFFNVSSHFIVIWLVVWNMCYFSHHIGNVIIPTVTHSMIFQRGWLKPPTSNVYNTLRFWVWLTPCGCVWK